MGQIGWSGSETALGKTSSADLRRLLGALWVNTDQNPLLNGGEVFGRSDRAYGYNGGVGVVQIGDGAVALTWGPGVTAPVTVPGTARTDVVYCGQDGAVRVGTQGSFSEADVVVLRRMAAPGGMTATSQAVPLHEPVWAMPYGAQIGWLGTHAEVHANGTPVTKAQHVVTELEFWVPTVRAVEFAVHQAIYSGSVANGAMQYQLFLDNVLVESWEFEFNGIHQIKNHTVWVMDVPEGVRTARLERRHTWGADPLFIGDTVPKMARGGLWIIDRGVGRA